MRTLTCFVLLAACAGCAVAGRLENTYLPPAGAAQAGGVNLAVPFRSGAPAAPAAPAAPVNTYLPPTAPGSITGVRAAGSSGSFSSGSSASFGASSASAAAAAAYNAAGRFSQQQQQAYQQQAYQQQRPALIIKQVNENPGDGTYTFSYETENGIQAQEQGQVRADGAEGLAAVQGAYAFTAPDNNVRYTVTYTADENGFLAYGDHLPTPPPVPAEIQRALEQNAADEARGLVDDGQYRAEHHGQQEQGSFLRGSSGSSGGYPSRGGYSSSSSSGGSGYQY